ncbi:phasin family protein [Aureimonas sp. AU12]|jgi:phasin|uniref:phasin family protein n=1 Tax=Aureimonas sp. AU12 TaxID=1638161 RepID=UPI000781B603|nr:phasin family protein [Aureimonas sp. AU12]
MSDTENFNSSDPAREAYDTAQKTFEKMTDPAAMRDAQAAMGLDPAKMTEAFRTMTERSMEQSKEAYARMKTASDQATKTLESTLENVHSGSLTLSKRAIEGMRAQAEMNYAHLEKLASARSMAEIIEMQTSFVRRQIEMVTDQAKDMQQMSQSVAKDVMQPARDAAKKTNGQDAF